jgi:hypothetical protein
MSTDTKTAGYPVHAVAQFVRWTNPFQARFTDWVASCGTRGSMSGHGAFGLAGSARRRELCTTCFPGQDWNGSVVGKPEELSDVEQLRASQVVAR